MLYKKNSFLLSVHFAILSIATCTFTGHNFASKRIFTENSVLHQNIPYWQWTISSKWSFDPFSFSCLKNGLASMTKRIAETE